MLYLDGNPEFVLLLLLHLIIIIIIDKQTLRELRFMPVKDEDTVNTPVFFCLFFFFHFFLFFLCVCCFGFLMPRKNIITVITN